MAEQGRATAGLEGGGAPSEPAVARRYLRESGLRDELVYAVARTRTVLLERLDAVLDEHEVKRNSYSTLRVVCTDGDVTQRELASVLRLDPSRLVTIVDDLQARGWVVRERSKADRRTWVVRPTAQGKVAAERMRVDIAAMDAQLLAGFTESRARELLSSLQQLSGLA